MIAIHCQGPGHPRVTRETSFVITTSDDGWLRTHDEVVSLLRYCATGAKITLHRVSSPGTTNANDATRRYEIRFARLGGDIVVSKADAYSLPCLAEPLAARVRSLCETAMRRDLVVSDA